MRETISTIVKIIVSLLVVFLVGAFVVNFGRGKYKQMSTQPNTFFFEDRFILVDTGTVGNRISKVYADTVTGVMYITYNEGISPLYNGDGTLMMYDPVG